MKSLTIEGKIWMWSGPSAWYFLPTSKEQGAILRRAEKGKPRAGFGSLRVRATIGKTSFETSLFPTKDGPYLLPVKASVRKSEGLFDKSRVVAKCVFL